MPKLTKLAQCAVEALEDLKGIDIKVLDVQHLTTVTDYMIICTGTSNRHVKSLADNVVDSAKKHGERPLGMEGIESSEWVLVDLGSVVVHVMQAQARGFYQLEKLWDVPPPEPVEPPKQKKAVGAETGAAGLPKRATPKAASASKKSAAKKSAAKKTASKATAKKKASSKTSAAKKAPLRTAAKKTSTVKKAAAKKAPAKKPAAKKSTARRKTTG